MLVMAFLIVVFIILTGYLGWRIRCDQLRIQALESQLITKAGGGTASSITPLTDEVSAGLQAEPTPEVSTQAAMHALMNKLPLGLLAVSAGGTIQFCNQHAALLLKHRLVTTPQQSPTTHTLDTVADTAIDSGLFNGAHLKDLIEDGVFEPSLAAQYSKVLGAYDVTELEHAKNTATNSVNDTWTDSSGVASDEHLQDRLVLTRLSFDAQEYLYSVEIIQSPLNDDEVERYKRSQYFACIGTWDWDVGTETLYWSEAIYGMFGYQIGEVTPSYSFFCSRVHPDDREKVRAGELRCIETGENHDEEYRVIWPDGSIHWVRETGNLVKNAQGEIIKMMGVVRDITTEKQLANELRLLAHHDSLTQLPNRIALEERLRRAISKARLAQSRVALVFIDLNNFKEINDTYGHRVGDEVLVAAADLLKKSVRENDTVARIGGDEFVIMMEDIALDKDLVLEARHICEHILIKLAEPISIGQWQESIDASLGVAMYPDHGLSMDELIHLADLAMYRAKRCGSSQFRLAQLDDKVLTRA